MEEPGSSGTKWCRGCDQVLDLSSFGLKYPGREVPRHLCRVCSRKASRMYYARDPAPYKARAKAGRKRAYQTNREKVREFLRESKCCDCGIGDFAVLDFDHRDRSQKRAEINRLLSISWKAISREIEKCDVVCANCHRKRTARQFGWRRLLGLEELVIPLLPMRGTADYERVKNKRNYLRRRHRNRTHIYQYLREHPCVLCGESDPVVLDFDHTRDKIREVTLIAAFGGWSSLLSEIAKCRVLCANCHRRETAGHAGRLR